MSKSKNVKIIKNEYGGLRYIEIRLPSSLDNIKEGIRTTKVYKNNGRHYLYIDKIIKDDDRYQLVITPAIRLDGCLFINHDRSCYLENEFALVTFTNTDKYYNISPNLVKPHRHLVVDLNFANLKEPFMKDVKMEITKKEPLMKDITTTLNEDGSITFNGTITKTGEEIFKKLGCGVYER